MILDPSRVIVSNNSDVTDNECYLVTGLYDGFTTITYTSGVESLPRQALLRQAWGVEHSEGNQKEKKKERRTDK